jgi:hypothetical protein
MYVRPSQEIRIHAIPILYLSGQSISRPHTSRAEIGDCDRTAWTGVMPPMVLYVVLIPCSNTLFLSNTPLSRTSPGCLSSRGATVV